MGKYAPQRQEGEGQKGTGNVKPSFTEKKSCRQVSGGRRNSETEKTRPTHRNGVMQLYWQKSLPQEKLAVLPDKPAGRCCSVSLAEG